MPAQVPGWLITQAQTEGVHHGLHHYPSGTDRARGRGSGWAQGTTPKGGLGSESRGIGSMCGWGARSQRQHDSGLPGSLPGVLTGPHPAVPRAPLPASRQQRLARLAEGRRSCSRLPGALQGVLTGPHPAVSRAPRPASGQQRLAGLAEGSVLGSPPALPSPNCHVPMAKLYYISIYILTCINIYKSAHLLRAHRRTRTHTHTRSSSVLSIVIHTVYNLYIYARAHLQTHTHTHTQRRRLMHG